MVAADSGSHWTEGVYDVYALSGNCYINQGLTYRHHREAVVWIKRAAERAASHAVYWDGVASISIRWR